MIFHVINQKESRSSFFHKTYSSPRKGLLKTGYHFRPITQDENNHLMFNH